MMLDSILPFEFKIDTVMIASSCIWSLALYLGFAPLREWIMEQLQRWFNFADGLMYMDLEEFKKQEKAIKSQNAFYASIFSIIPFLVIGGLLNWGVQIGLGRSWTFSFGLLLCIACAVYELGRRDTMS